MSRATERFAAAVDKFSRQVERLRPYAQMDEKEANHFGVESVREYRRENAIENGDTSGDRRQLSEEEISKWNRDRERRRGNDGYSLI